MALPIHSKIINKVARRILKPNGIERKGQSRTWLDDQYWYTTIIEFQPHNWKKGTFLNVGVNFHWNESEYFSFDIGSRLNEFVEFENEDQFEKEINSLVELALNRSVELKKMLFNITVSEKTIINHKFTSDNLSGNYHRAIICGLNNKISKSEHYFNLIMENNHNIAWANKLKSKIEILKEKLKNEAEFKNRINELIKISRMKKKLKKAEIKNVW